MKVTKIFALEPNPRIIRRAEERLRRTKLDIEFLDLPGKRIPLAKRRSAGGYSEEPG